MNHGHGRYEHIVNPVVRDAREVRDRLRDIMEDLIPWRDPRGQIPRVAVYPTHVEVYYYYYYYYEEGNNAPDAIAWEIRQAVEKYNQHRLLDEKLSPYGGEAKHPRIRFQGTPYGRALDYDGGVWRTGFT